MAQFSIDFSQVEEFEPLPAGEYPVVIDHVEMKLGKDEPHNPYLNFDLVVSDGEFSGRHLFMTGGLTTKSLWRTKALFQNLGVLEDQMELFVDDDSSYLLQPELSGLPAIAVVHNEVYNNRVQNRVDDLISAYEQATPMAPPPPAPPIQQAAPVQQPVAAPVAARPVVPSARPAMPTGTPPARPPVTNNQRPKLNLK